MRKLRLRNLKNLLHIKPLVNDRFKTLTGGSPTAATHVLPGYLTCPDFKSPTWLLSACRLPVCQGGWVCFLKSLHLSLDKSYLWHHHHSQCVVYLPDDSDLSLLLKGLPFVLTTAVWSAWNIDATSKNAWLFILGISLRACMPKSLQSCPTLCNPTDRSTPGFGPWDSPGKNTGVSCHTLLQRIFLTQESNLGVLSLHWQVLYH